MTIRILQITDLHVFCEPNVTLKGIPTRESLCDVVKFIQRHEAPFDHVIVTGDHTHDELPESYAAVRDILQAWGDSLWQIPGNHDDRSVLRSSFPHRIQGKGSERINFAFPTEQWLCVGLDTHIPGEVSGMIDDGQISWLRDLINGQSRRKVVLFMHHPPVEVGSEWMDRIGLSGRERLQSLIRDDHRIRFVCCGHVHHEFRFQVAGCEVFTTPSTGLQFDPHGSAPRFAADAPGYRVIELNGSDFSTRVVRLPEVRYTPQDD